jgi:ATP/maltotriose-dependent transcriptional regulator MalT
VRPAQQTVARDRLLDRLRATPGIKLRVVGAPAGCGATTFLRAWGALEETAMPVAWLSLDERDNDRTALSSRLDGMDDVVQLVS